MNSAEASSHMVNLLEIVTDAIWTVQDFCRANKDIFRDPKLSLLGEKMHAIACEMQEDVLSMNESGDTASTE